MSFEGPGTASTSAASLAPPTYPSKAERLNIGQIPGAPDANVATLLAPFAVGVEAEPDTPEPPQQTAQKPGGIRAEGTIADFFSGAVKTPAGIAKEQAEPEREPIKFPGRDVELNGAGSLTGTAATARFATFGKGSYVPDVLGSLAGGISGFIGRLDSLDQIDNAPDAVLAALDVLQQSSMIASALASLASGGRDSDAQELSKALGNAHEGLRRTNDAIESVLTIIRNENAPLAEELGQALRGVGWTLFAIQRFLATGNIKPELQDSLSDIAIVFRRLGETFPSLSRIIEGERRNGDFVELPGRLMRAAGEIAELFGNEGPVQKTLVVGGQAITFTGRGLSAADPLTKTFFFAAAASAIIQEGGLLPTAIKSHHVDLFEAVAEARASPHISDTELYIGMGLAALAQLAPDLMRNVEIGANTALDGSRAVSVGYKHVFNKTGEQIQRQVARRLIDDENTEQVIYADPNGGGRLLARNETADPDHPYPFVMGFNKSGSYVAGRSSAISNEVTLISGAGEIDKTYPGESDTVVVAAEKGVYRVSVSTDGVAIGEPEKVLSKRQTKRLARLGPDLKDSALDALAFGEITAEQLTAVMRLGKNERQLALSNLVQTAQR